eukprot:TRINITY_DN8189_c0_g5_i2.p2 TRINITY_DN8189_c0_g5~~TRINITY_DN8189_c0_g5_i2.p2  ORF type:complete len:266 (+),score=66.21 TRINITY_DN8189_c0_g5_i2:35-832(+)
MSAGVEGFGGVREGKLVWFCEPGSWKVDDATVVVGQTEGTGGRWTLDNNKLRIYADSKKDFWRRTFYTPTLIKDDAPCLFASIPSTDEVTIETAMTLTPKKQFDQGGIAVRIDSEHWIKAGIEFVDGSPRLSCVVTNIFSDWSTQHWRGSPSISSSSSNTTNNNDTIVNIRLRLHKKKDHSFAFEAAPFDPNNSNDSAPVEWTFVRIGHLSSRIVSKGENPGGDGEEDWKMGVFAASPIEQAGCEALFHYLRIGPLVPPVHDVNL